MARTVLRRLAESAALGPALALCERLDSAHPRVLRVLTYHRVDAAAPFERQMEFLAERHAVVSVAHVLGALDGGPPLPKRAVLLTFDDAYRSFAEVAWPILRRRGFAAALFVPTAYPDRDEPRFWWDRLEQGFARTALRTPLATPLGELPMATEAERARAHGLVKRHVKGLAHVETLARTDELCAALGLPSEPHEVLGWDELRALARQGVALGAHSRTHPRLDRVEPARARAEILGSLADLERELPEQARLFAYPDGGFDDGLVELVRAAGVELAFTTRRGTNRIGKSDRLRLRRLHVDARDSVEVLRAKLLLSAARLEPATRLLDPPSSAERRAERAERRERRRARLVLRSLDAVLTADLRPPSAALVALRGAASPRTSHYERLGRLSQLAIGHAPALGRRVRGALLDTRRLPLACARLEPVAFGSGTTVFRLETPQGAAFALKVYRRTLGRDPQHLAAAARRYRERYRRLAAHFGAVVLPAEFLVLHAPLRGTRAVACLQPWLAGETSDPLRAPETEARPRLDAEAAEQLAAFARRALAWRAEGVFPDLFGRGNLVWVEERGRRRLRLIDYGIFHLRDTLASSALTAPLEAVVRRLEGWLEGMERDVVQSG